MKCPLHNRNPPSLCLDPRLPLLSKILYLLRSPFNPRQNNRKDPSQRPDVRLPPATSDGRPFGFVVPSFGRLKVGVSVGFLILDFLGAGTDFGKPEIGEEELSFRGDENVGGFEVVVAPEEGEV